MQKILLVLFLFFISFLNANANQTKTNNTHLNLTQAEEKFIQNHPKIVLGTGDSWAPYNIKNSDGTLSGYDQDILNKINKVTGANFVQRQGNWSTMQKLAKEKKIDGLSTLTVTTKRKEFLNFSNIYISLQKMVMVKQRNPLNIQSSSDMVGKTIVIHKGNVADEKAAKQFPNSKIIYANTPKEMLEEVIFGKADATFGNGATEYMLSQIGLPYMENAFTLSNSLDLAFAVRKDWTEAISILNKGLATISQHERTQLKQKWFSNNNNNNNNNIELTKEEQQWIETNIVKIGVEQWAPILFSNNGSDIDGICGDFTKLIIERTGLKTIIVNGEWDKLLTDFKNKKLDILPDVFYTEKRKQYGLFSDSYFKIKDSIFVKNINNKIHSLADLKGKTLAMQKGNGNIDKIKQKFPNIKLIFTKNLDESINHVLNGEVTAFYAGQIAVETKINNELIKGLKSVSIKAFKAPAIHFFSKIDEPILATIIQKGLKSITFQEKKSIIDKWLIIRNNTINLAKEETEYLKNKTITICGNNGWAPIEFKKNNKMKGIAVDVIKKLENKLNVAFKYIQTENWAESLQFLKEKKCDILAAAKETNARKKYAIFTKPYLNLDLVVITKNDKQFIKNIKQIENKDILMKYKSGKIPFIKTLYPNLNIAEKYSIESELFQGISKGNGYGTISTLAVASYMKQKYDLNNLQITGYLDETYNLSIATHKDNIILLNIMNKALDNISSTTIDNIYSKWTSIKINKTIDYTIIWQILFIFLIVILAGLYWNIKLKKEISKRRKIEKQLSDLNDQLEIKIQNAVDDVEKKEKLLRQQSKLAQMGEMISMIAHQWRQPLGAINSAIIATKMNIISNKFNLDDIDERKELFNIINQKHDNITEYVNILSTTIDDFRNFFKPNKNKENISLTEPINRALKIVEAALSANGIKIVKTFDIDTTLLMYQNELMQVILNIIKNCEDNFKEKNIEESIINIVTKQIDNKHIISICDNGGGIPDDILPDIFNPYFSTKNEKNGTGLGLYMSKIMIEEHSGGQLNVFNTKDGVCFEIVHIIED